MVRLVSGDIRRIEGERAQNVVASEQRHGDDGAVGRVQFNLRRIEVEPGIAVVHRLTVGDDPSCYARSEDNTAALESLSVAPANMHRFDLNRIRLLQVKDAGRVTHNILKPRREDREHIAQIQASPNRLSYFVECYHLAMG